MTAPYITVADVERAISLRKLTQLSNDAPNAAAPDAAVIDDAIVAAQQMVDGYLRARYLLPLDPVPTIIRSLTLNLVCYRLYARRMESAVPETVKDQHLHTLKVLDQIQAGKVTLGNAATHKALPEAGAIRIKVPPRQFGEATLAQWRM